jgi:Suppressor of fused protein (SUFU)
MLAWMSDMDEHRFYTELFAPLERTIGPLDSDTIVAIVGFDVGGPLNFCTIGHGKGRFTTYVSCELAVRSEQQPAEFGRYELLTTCDDEKWVRSIVTDIGRMSLEVAFDDGHTLDIGSWVEPTDFIQGVVFETVCESEIDGEAYGVLRVVGVSRPEMDFARAHGSSSLLERLTKAGVYPNTTAARSSVV